MGHQPGAGIVGSQGQRHPLLHPQPLRSHVEDFQESETGVRKYAMNDLRAAPKNPH